VIGVAPEAGRSDVLPEERRRDVGPGLGEPGKDRIGDDDGLRPEVALDRVGPALDDRRPGQERSPGGEVGELELLADVEVVRLEEDNLRELPAATRSSQMTARSRAVGSSARPVSK